MPGFGFAIAATTLVGQGSVRAIRSDRGATCLSQRLAMLLMALMGVMFFVFAGPLLDIFIDDPAVVQLGIWPLRLVAFSQPALATMMVLSGGLRGSGRHARNARDHGRGLWLVRVPLAMLLTGPLGLLGADRDGRGSQLPRAGDVPALPQRTLGAAEGLRPRP